jgi:hypothetical protein
VSIHRKIETLASAYSARLRLELASLWLYAKDWKWLTSLDNFRTGSSVLDSASRSGRSLDYASSLNGLKTLIPGRLKSRSFPVAIVSPWRRAVAAI